MPVGVGGWDTATRGGGQEGMVCGQGEREASAGGLLQCWGEEIGRFGAGRCDLSLGHLLELGVGI